MGMIIEGQWCEVDRIHRGDEYSRPVSDYHTKISECDIINHPKRFYLIGSWSCPWSHRTLIYRELLGLSQYVELHMTGGEKVQGYAANHGLTWQIPGATNTPESHIIHLHQLYRYSDPHYTGRSTVPILWDSQQQEIISNESLTIIEIFKKAAQSNKQLTPDQRNLSKCYEEQLMTQLNQAIYDELSNGVYKAAFAKSQRAYDKALTGVFDKLQFLENKLKQSAYLTGDHPHDADWLVFPTLIRFDIEYYLHSGCCYKQLRDFPFLWRYTNRLYNYSGVAQTVNFKAIHQSNFLSTTIQPVMPDILFKTNR